MSTVSQSAHPVRRGFWHVDPQILANQGEQNGIAIYFPRKISKYVTSICAPMGMSANLMTALWVS